MRGVFSLPDFISEEGSDIIRKLLTVNPKKRINIQEIRNHDWVKKGGMCFKIGRPVKLEAIKRPEHKVEISPIQEKPNEHLHQINNTNNNDGITKEYGKFVPYKLRLPTSAKKKEGRLVEKEKTETENSHYNEVQRINQEKIKNYISNMKKMILKEEPCYVPIDNEFITNIEISFNNNYNNIVIADNDKSNMDNSVSNVRPFRIRSKTPVREENLNNKSEINEQRYF